MTDWGDTRPESDFAVRWVKVRSWHAPSGLISRGGMIHTLCGRWAPATADRSAELPSREKSCESCLRNREVRDS